MGLLLQAKPVVVGITNPRACSYNLLLLSSHPPSSSSLPSSAQNHKLNKDQVLLKSGPFYCVFLYCQEGDTHPWEAKPKTADFIPVCASSDVGWSCSSSPRQFSCFRQRRYRNLCSQRGPNSCPQSRLQHLLAGASVAFSRTWAMNYFIFCLLASAVQHQALRTKFLKVSKDVEVLPAVF